jgi:O-antigen ligase/Tfp pilus assembly protein PilF
MDKVKLSYLIQRNLINFIVFAMPLVFFQPLFDPFGPVQLMVARVFIPLLFLVYAYRCSLDGKMALKYNPMNLPMALYTAACGASIFFAMNRDISFKYFSEIAVMISGAYMIFNCLEKNDINRVIYILILSHTLMALYGIMQHFSADPFNWNTNFGGRPLGTIGNPDFFAGELLASAMLTLSYAVFGRKHRAVMWFCFASQVFSIYFTKVAGAYIGFAAGAAVFTCAATFINREQAARWSARNWKKAVLVLAICCVLLGTVTAVFSGAISKAVDEKKRSLTHRLLMWESSMLMIEESPVIGKGFGNFRLYFPMYQGRLLNDPKNNEFDYVVTWMPHQNYLLIAAETGLIGLGFFILAVAVFYRTAFKAVASRQNAHPAAVGFAAAVSALLAASFFNTFYNIPATTFIFFVMLFGVCWFSGESRAYIVKRGLIAVVMTAVSVIALLFIFSDARTIPANMYLKQADSYSKKEMLREAAAYYEKVISLKPVELCPQTDVGQYYYLAEVYRKAGDVKKAAEYYRKDLVLNPYCPEVNNMLGAAEGQLGNIDESIKRLELAVFVAPHYEAAYTNLATAYIAKKDLDGAENTLMKFLAKNGPNTNMQNLLAELARMKRAGANAR